MREVVLLPTATASGDTDHERHLGGLITKKVRVAAWRLCVAAT
jgi:hypothetical protein